MEYEQISVPDFDNYKTDLLGERSKVVESLCGQLKTIAPIAYKDNHIEPFTQRAKEIKEVRWDCTRLIRFLNRVNKEDKCSSLRERAGETLDLVEDQLKEWGYSQSVYA